MSAFIPIPYPPSYPEADRLMYRWLEGPAKRPPARDMPPLLPVPGFPPLPPEAMLAEPPTPSCLLYSRCGMASVVLPGSWGGEAPLEEVEGDRPIDIDIETPFEDALELPLLGSFMRPPPPIELSC